MAQKSILEQALLQVEKLEEAVKANAKGILASTMKQELNDLLKEQEDIDPEEEEKDVTDAPVDDENSDNEVDDTELPTGDEELPAVDDESDEEEPEMELPVEDEDSEDVLDMTGASEEEVLKVFKAMKPEDGIVVKREGNSVSFEDDGNEYIIKLDDEAEETEELPDDEEMPGEEELPDELAEQTEPTDDQEIVYEIELDDEDEESQEFEVSEGENSPFDKNVKGDRKEIKENVPLPTKSNVAKGPFTKKAEGQVGKGIHKLQANEESFVADAKRPGTAPKGTNNPETKEPGRGQVKTSDGRPGTAVKDMDTPKKFDDLGKGKATTSTRPTPVKGMGKPVTKEPKEQKECAECGDKAMKEVEATESLRTFGAGVRGLTSKKTYKAGRAEFDGSTVVPGSAKNLNEELETLKAQNSEYKKALILFKDKLNEVAVFNASLAYATRLFTEHSTTRKEKLDILKRFDTVSTITESKNLYTSIKGELENKKPITETAVEKIVSTKASSSSEMLSESKAYENPQFKRMKELMQKLK